MEIMITILGVALAVMIAAISLILNKRRKAMGAANKLADFSNQLAIQSAALEAVRNQVASAGHQQQKNLDHVRVLAVTIIKKLEAMEQIQKAAATSPTGEEIVARKPVQPTEIQTVVAPTPVAAEPVRKAPFTRLDAYIAARSAGEASSPVTTAGGVSGNHAQTGAPQPVFNQLKAEQLASRPLSQHETQILRELVANG